MPVPTITTHKSTHKMKLRSTKSSVRSTTSKKSTRKQPIKKVTGNTVARKITILNIEDEGEEVDCNHLTNDENTNNKQDDNDEEIYFFSPK